MAPEQVAGHPADGRTDVYAVGELLFEMLTGVAPCGGSDIIAVFNKKANEDPPPVRSFRSDVPLAIEQMLTRAMSRLPAARQATMADLKDEMMSCLARVDAAPVQAGGTTRSEIAASRTGRVWRPPSRALWIAAAGVVAGLGLTSMAVLWRTNVGSDGPRGSAMATKSAATMAVAPPRSVAAPTAGHVAAPAVSPAWIAAARLAGAAPPDHPELPNLPNPAPMATTGSTIPPTSPRQSTRTRTVGTAGSRPHRKGAHATPAAAPTPNSVASQPTDSLARGRTAFAKGNFPEAVRLARASVSGGDAVGGHLLLGDAFYRMERFDEAIAEYDTVLRLAPRNDRARRGRELATRRAAP